MPIKPICFKDKLTLFSEYWSPRVIAEMNNYQFKLAKFSGEFVWHDHKDTDEVFIVLEGKMSILFREDKVELSAGEMFVVPKGVEHKPEASDECHVMLIEPKGVINTGESSSELTAENNVWI